MSEACDYLGFRLRGGARGERIGGTSYTFIAARPVLVVKAKIRALTHRTSQKDLGYVLTCINMVLRGRASYFRRAFAQRVFDMLGNFTWRRVIRMRRERHHWRWKDVRRRFTTPAGRWPPVTASEIELKRIAAIPVTRYRHRSSKIPNPWVAQPA